MSQDNPVSTHVLFLVHGHSHGKGWWEWGGVGVQDLSQLGVQTQPVPSVEVVPQEGPNFLVLLCEVTPAGECGDCSPVLGILPKNAVNSLTS